MRRIQIVSFENRRFLISLLAALATSAALGAAGAAGADEFPSKPVRVIVAFAPGSITDSVGRILADDMSRRLGQPIIVENRAGAFGQIAASFVATSAADGYTVLLTTNTTHSANPHLYKTLPYDPIKDFEPVARAGSGAFLLVVHPTVPAKTTAEFLAYAKANPGKLTYGTSNSTSLVAAETINIQAQVSMVGVPYKSSPQAALDLVAGRLHVMVGDFATLMPQVKDGKLRALAVPTAKRSALMPELPLIADALKGFDIKAWAGYMVPTGTPKPIVDRLARAVLDAVANPEVKAKLALIGFETDPLGPEAFGRFMREELDHWGRMIKNAKIQSE
jgi:tripartite-type tricarboxylate transporter receptor subunit TctC